MSQTPTNQVPLISGKGSELLLKLYNGVRSLMTVQHDVSALRKTIEDLLKDGGKLTIGVRTDRLFLNDCKIEMSSGHAVHRILLNEFKKRRISRIEFSEPPELEDLEKFLRFLVMMRDHGQIDGEMFQRFLERKNIGFVRVEGLRPGGGNTERGFPSAGHGHNTRIYFYGLQLVKEMFDSKEKGESLDLGLAKRLVRSMVSGYLDDPAAFMRLATTKTNRDFLANHSVNVAVYAIALGHRLEMSTRLLGDLGLAALFHDIGEGHLQEESESGEQELTEEGWEETRMHPFRGVKIVMNAGGLNETELSRLISGIFEHHLRYDRSGFLKLRKKENISLVGRIIALADFYDLAARPYGKRQFPCFSDRLVAMIVDRRGKDFDPILTKYFVRVLGRLPVGSLCRLDTGESGIVCGMMEEGTAGDRPWVRLLVPAGESYRSGDLVNLDSTDEKTGKYRRSISEILDPNEMGIDVAEYLISF